MRGECRHERARRPRTANAGSYARQFGTAIAMCIRLAVTVLQAFALSSWTGVAPRRKPFPSLVAVGPIMIADPWKPNIE